MSRPAKHSGHRIPWPGISGPNGHRRSTDSIGRKPGPIRPMRQAGRRRELDEMWSWRFPFRSDAIFHEGAEFTGMVAAGIGLIGNFDSEMGAKRFPAIAEIVNEEPPGRHSHLHRLDIRLKDGDGVIA